MTYFDANIVIDFMEIMQLHVEVSHSNEEKKDGSPGKWSK